MAEPLDEGSEQLRQLRAEALRTAEALDVARAEAAKLATSVEGTNAVMAVLIERGLRASEDAAHAAAEALENYKSPAEQAAEAAKKLAKAQGELADKSREFLQKGGLGGEITERLQAGARAWKLAGDENATFGTKLRAGVGAAAL